MTVTATYKCEHTAKFSGPTEQEGAEQAKEEYCIACDLFHRDNGVYPIVSNELVALEGSEKQVVWAVRLREEKIDLVHSFIKRAKMNNTSEEVKRGRAAFLAVINEQTQAKWWIDNRDRSGLKAFASAYEKAYNENS